MNVSHCRKQHERLLWVLERPNEFPGCRAGECPLLAGLCPSGKLPEVRW